MRRAIGVLDIGRATIKSGLVDPSTGELFRTFPEIDTPTPVMGEDPIEAKNRFSSVITAHLDRIQDRSDVALIALGVMVPGPFVRIPLKGAPGRYSAWFNNFQDGKEITIVNSHGMDMSEYLDKAGVAFTLQSDLQRATSLPAFLVGDAAGNLIAEHRIGAAQGEKDVALLISGRGVGFAAMKDGQLIVDENLNGMRDIETMKSLEGKPLSLDLDFEQSVSGPGLERKFGRRPSSSDWEMAEYVVNLQAPFLKKWLNQTQSKVLVVTGGVAARLGVAYRDLLTEVLRAEPNGIDVEVRATALDRKSGLVGAAVVALDGLGLDSQSVVPSLESSNGIGISLSAPGSDSN